MEIISPSGNVLDLGIYMSGDCTFNYHISTLSKKCANLSGWILRLFYTSDCITMLTLFKSILLSRLDYGSHIYISDQTYNSTREDTTVIHQTYYRDEWYALS